MCVSLCMYHNKYWKIKYRTHWLILSARKCCNILAVRRSVRERFEEQTQQDDSEFFTALMYSEINILELELKHVTSCSNAKCNYNVTMLEKSGLLILPSTLKRCHSANYWLI